MKNPLKHQILIIAVLITAMAFFSILCTTEKEIPPKEALPDIDTTTYIVEDIIEM